MSGFTLEELLAALGEKPEEMDGYHSSKEWAEMLGTNVRRMRELIGEAVEAGIVRRQRVKREAIDLTSRWTTLYAFKLDEKEEIENDS